MSAATFTREAVVGPAPRVRHPRTSPQTRRLATGARACSLPGVGVSSGLSDRSLLAVMVAVVLVFLFGLVVLVQGFWVASQAPAPTVAQAGIVTLG